MPSTTRLLVGATPLARSVLYKTLSGVLRLKRQGPSAAYADLK